MEQCSLSRAQVQADRSRVEGEERRKNINHQQEQERVTAQYKAQLESEAYQKKLQDQQRQNEDWLQQQHNQFLRQEEIKKKTEQEMLNLRLQQMREEKALERESMKQRILEETKGKIQHERENIDVHLRQLRAKAAEERKTKLDSIQNILSGVGGAFNALLEDKTKLTTFVGGMTAIAVGIYGARAGTRVTGKYIEARMGKPPLVRETSRWTFTRSSLNPFQWLRSRAPPKFQEKIVLPQELAERLEWTTNSLISAKANGTPFRHLCLHGSPGTGKTLFARTLARSCGMDYAIMTGGDVGPLGSSATAEINKLFKWANNTSKGLVLFIDEAEAFLRQGRGTASGMSEDMRNVLSAFLHHTGTESDKFCVVIATNCRSVIDKAVLDRLDEQFEFPLPSMPERSKMATMFFNEYIQRPTKKGKVICIDPLIDDAFLEFVAKKTEGFSGRQMAKLFIGMQAAVFGSGSNTLTKGLAETVLNWKLAHLQEDVDTIARTQADHSHHQHHG
eukprot:GHVS01095792.1.p1 GENE.GHVS01095792.1~~GHVS01095792.1.p1  ORF type:complete len:505 (-),score=93.93 GHVS01095792.1:218-1732(-)